MARGVGGVILLITGIALMGVAWNLGSCVSCENNWLALGWAALAGLGAGVLAGGLACFAVPFGVVVGGFIGLSIGGALGWCGFVGQALGGIFGWSFDQVGWIVVGAIIGGAIGAAIGVCMDVGDVFLDEREAGGLIGGGVGLVVGGILGGFVGWVHGELAGRVAGAIVGGFIGSIGGALWFEEEGLVFGAIAGGAIGWYLGGGADIGWILGGIVGALVGSLSGVGIGLIVGGLKWSERINRAGVERYSPPRPIYHSTYLYHPTYLPRSPVYAQPIRPSPPQPTTPSASPPKDPLLKKLEGIGKPELVEVVTENGQVSGEKIASNWDKIEKIFNEEMLKSDEPRRNEILSIRDELKERGAKRS